MEDQRNVPTFYYFIILLFTVILHFQIERNATDSCDQRKKSLPLYEERPAYQTPFLPEETTPTFKPESQDRVPAVLREEQLLGVLDDSKEVFGAAGCKDPLSLCPVSGLLMLPSDISGFLLGNLDLKEVLLLRSLSKRALEWVDAALPRLTRIEWSSDADCTEVERTLCALVYMHKIKLHTINARFHNQPTKFPAMAVLAGGCENLRDLCLSGSANIDDTSVQALARSCPSLQSFNVQGCTEVTFRSINEVAQHCPELVWADVGGCPLVNDDCIIRLARGCPRLMHLNLARCQVGNIAVLAVVNYCPELRYLNLARCKKMTNDAVRTIGHANSKLQTLIFDSNRCLGDSGIQALANCVLLQSLSINDSKMTDDSLTLLAEHCPKLRSLDIRGSSSITEESINSVLAKCSLLEQLDLSFCKYIDTHWGCNQICNVKRLCLASLPRMTDDTLKMVACNWPCLQELDIRCSQQITSEGLVFLAKNCPRLTTVNIDFCPLVTDEALFQFVASLTHLTHLGIAGCLQLSDEAVIHIIERCISLKYLRLSKPLAQISGFQARTKRKELDIHVFLTALNHSTHISGRPEVSLLSGGLF
ncbi:hypothetical protein CYMTET_40845 [Cymbomonas tetramitiformis]|uniref:F-box/LRR-repeat protein 15-like leucin rich repeat domain-containing protein n=1 Tax=Cymbomonas tetramitiformis TaxID=36881 RepID=A0AAE0C910_9CHLO|nr:hypothetical protein CYMTET_40845 [Cymbomonas tetramitiformis]